MATGVSVTVVLLFFTSRTRFGLTPATAFASLLVESPIVTKVGKAGDAGSLTMVSGPAAVPVRVRALIPPAAPLPAAVKVAVFFSLTVPVSYTHLRAHE